MDNAQLYGLIKPLAETLQRAAQQAEEQYQQKCVELIQLEHLIQQHRVTLARLEHEAEQERRKHESVLRNRHAVQLLREAKLDSCLTPESLAALQEEHNVQLRTADDLLPTDNVVQVLRTLVFEGNVIPPFPTLVSFYLQHGFVQGSKDARYLFCYQACDEEQCLFCHCRDLPFDPTRPFCNLSLCEMSE